MADQSKFPPFARPVGSPDPEPEQIFPGGLDCFRDRADEPLKVWNAEGATEMGYRDHHVSNVRNPLLFSYPAPSDRNTGTAVLICPGGGYALLAADKEGHDFARLFNSVGVTAFVLYYPMPQVNGIPGEFPEMPLRSVQRALRLIRSRASEYGLDPDKVGVMGFSAGAHLAATASTLWQNAPEDDPALKKFSARPSFSILAYPVISMIRPDAHAGSVTNLLGKNPTEEMKRKYSPELQVTPETPPAFLVQAENDSVVVENSIVYFMALKNNGVKAELHIYPEGGHGYGMTQRGMAIDSWKDRLTDWILRF